MEKRKKLVFEIITKKVDGEPSCKIEESTRLKEDLWFDSLDALDLKMDLEREFDIEIPDEMSERFKTIRDILDYLDKVLPAE